MFSCVVHIFNLHNLEAAFAAFIYKNFPICGPLPQGSDVEDNLSFVGLLCVYSHQTKCVYRGQASS